MGQLEQSGFKRKEHPADGRDLAPCEFLLFGSVKEELKGRSFYWCFLNLGGRVRLTCFCESLPTGIEGCGFIF
jgi:hypothetical protein